MKTKPKEKRAKRPVRRCRKCGCTERQACVTTNGPCSWSGPDLCSACAGEPMRGTFMMFHELHEMNAARQQTDFKNCKDWTLTDWACALAGETGEACNLIKKLKRGDHVKREDIGKELADVVTYAEILAAALGLDLGRCVQQKFNEVSKRVKSPLRL